MQKLKVRLFIYIKEIIDEQKKGFFAFFLKAFLYAISLFISFYVFLKNFFYDKGFFKQKKFKPFVISIGNIVAGGTGKTPFLLN